METNSKATSASVKKLQFWSPHIEQWRASKLSQAEYCQREGLPVSRFSYWRRKIEESAQALPSTEEPKNAFIEIVAESTPVNSSAIPIRVGAIEIMFSHNTDMDLLNKLMSGLEVTP